MHGYRQVHLVVALFLTVGCTSVSSNQYSVETSLLRGEPAQVRERLLTQIPIGTPQLEAERLATSLGLELTPQSEMGSEALDSINCRTTVRKGLFGEAFWLIQIDCPDGTVSNIICEQIGIDYW